MRFQLFHLLCCGDIFLLLLSLVSSTTTSTNNNNAHHQHTTNNRVDVAVYYESLCPDSIEFFTQQLYPSLQGHLSDYVNLTLIPYGRATLKKTSEGSYEFTCPHGPPECHGNKLHACAIKLIDEPLQTNTYNKMTTGFINCLMDKVTRSSDKTTADFPTRACASLNHVTPEKVAAIEMCATMNDTNNEQGGARLLGEMARLTAALMPPLRSVPTIVFNRQYKREDSDLARHHFVRAMCQYIIDGGRPVECNASSGAGGGGYSIRGGLLGEFAVMMHLGFLIFVVGSAATLH